MRRGGFMEFERALEHLLDGDAILFIGAGFSSGAKNLRGEEIKTGRELAVHFARATELPDSTPLDDASEEFQLKHGEDSLISELQQEFTAMSIGEYHRAIASLPWRRVYTTNYDNVLETAYRDNSRLLTPVTPGDQIKNIPKAHTLCVHLNGYIERLTRETLGSEFKLTDVSYVSGSLFESPWVVLLRQDLRLARTVFFVGYSLADLDIKRLLFQTSNLTDKTFFALGAESDPVIVRRASRFGTVLPLDTAGFANAAVSRKASYSPREPVERIGLSIERFQAPREVPPFSDRLIFDLLLHGDLNSAFVWSDLHDGHAYFVERSVTTQVLNHLDGSTPAIVVHSDLGNGKTALLEGIKCRAIERGYHVYSVTARTDDLFNEVAAVLALDTKILLVIDDYPTWLDVIEYVGTNAKPETALLFSARSAIHDLMIDRVCALLDRRTVAEISVDHLSEDDLVWLAECFDEYGLWGDRASWSLEGKLRHLKQACKSEFHAVLLSVLESPQILSRFSKVIDDIKAERGHYQVLLTILVLAVLQYPTAVDTLLDIWGETVLETQFRRNAAVGQLLDIHHGTVLMRSSVAAQFILQRIISDASLVTEVLTQMASVADRAARTSALYWNMLRDLMRFSSLQLVLPERNRRVSVIRYYESIKNLAACRRNPHFWLQYGIASIILEDFERVERYFQTAYSLAESRDDYNTYMIDNHFARFLLLRAIRQGDPDTAMSAFRKARQIINQQIKSERLHYPYRVAASYAEFFDTFEARLTPNQRAEIAQAGKYVANQIAKLSEQRRQQKYVADCAKAMQRVMARAGLASDSSAS